MHLLLQELLNAVVLGGIYSLLAVSLTFIHAVSKQLQLAHGDVMILGAYTGYFTLLVIPNLLVGVVAGLIVGALTGLVLNEGVYRWLRNAGHMYLVAGLALSAIIEEALLLGVFQGRPVTYPAAVVGSNPGLGYELLILGVSIVLGGAFELFLQRTRYGRALRVTADNPEMARLLGIPVNRMIRLSFVMGSAMAAGAGVLLAVIFQYITPSLGATIGLTAIAIVLLGGLGSISGAVVGSFVVSFSQTFVSTYVSSGYSGAIAFGIILLIILFRPNGLFGTPVEGRA